MKSKKNEDKSKITYKDKPKEYEVRQIETVTIDNKKHCKDFINGSDGFCINYTGSKRDISSCYNRCKIYIPKEKKREV